MSLIDGKAQITGTDSMHCDHCAAVCPSEAIRVRTIDPSVLELATMENRQAYVDYGQYDEAGLVQLMRSRRSCRSYTEEPVPLALLQDLAKIGMTAPSGTNCQLWTFTLLPDRRAVETLMLEIAGFFRKLNKMVRRPVARAMSKLFMGDVLGRYHREYAQTVQEALDDWDQHRIDRLFHGAPAVMLVAVRPGASCPGEDALLATQNILLAAHAVGLGTCLVGYAVEAIKRAPVIKRRVGLPEDERIYAVIALGYPGERYERLTGRRPAPIRVIGAGDEAK